MRSRREFICDTSGRRQLNVEFLPHQPDEGDEGNGRHPGIGDAGIQTDRVALNLQILGGKLPDSFFP